MSTLPAALGLYHYGVDGHGEGLIVLLLPAISFFVIIMGVFSVSFGHMVRDAKDGAAHFGLFFGCIFGSSLAYNSRFASAFSKIASMTTSALAAPLPSTSGGSAPHAAPRRRP